MKTKAIPRSYEIIMDHRELDNLVRWMGAQNAEEYVHIDEIFNELEDLLAEGKAGGSLVTV